MLRVGAASATAGVGGPEGRPGARRCAWEGVPGLWAALSPVSTNWPIARNLRAQDGRHLSARLRGSGPHAERCTRGLGEGRVPFIHSGIHPTIAPAPSPRSTSAQVPVWHPPSASRLPERSALQQAPAEGQ